jgi:hypothetical protein
MQYKIAHPIKRLLAALIDILLLIPLLTIGFLVINRLLYLPVTPNFSVYSFEITMDE